MIDFWRNIMRHGRRTFGPCNHHEKEIPGKQPLSPLYVETVNTAWHDEEKKHKRQERAFWRRSIYLTFAAALAAFAAAFFARSASNSAETQLALAYPPKFRFVDFEITDKTGHEVDQLTPGATINIHGEVFESGRDDATVTIARCQILWHGKNLPMRRPYMDEPSPGCPLQTAARHSLPFTFSPGSFAWFNLSTTVPNDLENTTLYVIGFLQFKDRITPVRYSLFARRYDADKSRFAKVDNTDYEREDEQALDDKSP